MKNEIVDLEQFADPLAAETQWVPIKTSREPFAVHELAQINSYEVRFQINNRTKWQFKILFVIFLGLTFFGIIRIALYRRPTPLYQQLDITFLFLVGIFCLFSLPWSFYKAKIPIVFDCFNGYFWKGWKMPTKEAMVVPTHPRATKIESIHAIQIILRPPIHQNSMTRYYQINLVLDNGRRLHVIEYSGHHGTLNTAKTLSDLLDKPIWDGTP